MSQVHLPKEQQEQLVAIDARIKELLLNLGKLEMSYSIQKEELKQKVDQATTEFHQALTAAARAHGVDDDKARWNFDFNAMTLTRESQPSRIVSPTGAPLSV